LTATITDKDGDTASDTVNLGSAISFKDDAPVVVDKTDLIYANSSNDGGGAALGGTGIYHYGIGADSRTMFDSSHSDFSAITLAGAVGLNALQNVSTSWAFESASSAVFNFAFDYVKDPTNPTALTHDTGILTFDKVAGTYTVELAAPIDAYSTLSTSSATSFVGYQLGSNTTSTSQPDVMVTTLAPNFFVQFTGDHDTHSVPLTAGGNNAYVNGENFAAADTWVSVSGDANGVAGDTIQKGEVLDFNFYSTNPTGFVGATPTAQASAMYLRFDNLGGGDDIVVNLKLYDTVTHSYMTQAVVIDNGDILKHGDTIPAGYTALTALDNNDGLAIIESNDYNSGGTHWVIVGAQILGSTEGITGSGINLNGATGSGGGSSGTESFSTVADSGNTTTGTYDADVIKISDVGIVTQTTSTQDANLQFTFTNVDADGDATATQMLNVQIEGSNTFIGGNTAESIYGTAGNDTMTGGLGADIFQWHSGDHGTSITPAVDHITDFSKTQGDKLNLADLLQGESAGTLSQYLSFADESGHAVLKVSTTAGGSVEQKIVFDNYTVAQLVTEFAAADAVDLITKMKTSGNLITD
jgi:hypothetical protein